MKMDCVYNSPVCSDHRHNPFYAQRTATEITLFLPMNWRRRKWGGGGPSEVDEATKPFLIGLGGLGLCIFRGRLVMWPPTKKRTHRGDVFLPAWDFDTCFAAANWTGSLSNEIFARCARAERKVTHYNYSTWFTELSHLALPTFTLISFGDLGEMCVCVFECPGAAFLYSCRKIKFPCWHTVFLLYNKWAKDDEQLPPRETVASRHVIMWHWSVAVVLYLR